MAVTPNAVRKAALALPGVTEAPSYGTPGFKVGGKLMARLHQDGESLVVRVDLLERDWVLKMNPAVFHLTDHYVGYPWVLVRLAAISPALLETTLQQAWELVQVKRAPRRRKQ